MELTVQQKIVALVVIMVLAIIKQVLVFAMLDGKDQTVHNKYNVQKLYIIHLLNRMQ